MKPGDPDLQEQAVYVAGLMGEPGIPLLEQAFETGNLNLQEEVVHRASLMGEMGFPLLEQAL